MLLLTFVLLTLATWSLPTLLCGGVVDPWMTPPPLPTPGSGHPALT